MVDLCANSGDPDRTSRSVASDLGLRYLLITLLGISRQQWFGDVFMKFSYCMKIFVVCTHYNRLNEAILMSTLNIALFYRRSKRHP